MRKIRKAVTGQVLAAQRDAAEETHAAALDAAERQYNDTCDAIRAAARDREGVVQDHIATLEAEAFILAGLS